MAGTALGRVGTDYVVPLTALRADESRRAGAKAASLGELARAGFPVPDGFVLTTAAFARFLAANGLGSDASPEQVAAAPLPADVADALRAAALTFADAALAVRSSGVAEDLPDASFAGQYETVLGVRGAEPLIDAVRRCWASAFGARVAAYRAGRGQAPAGMAILVQRMVAADAAGVAFTANPLTGDRGETVVSAVRGLGERLVSGQASPDEWVVRGAEAVCRSAPEGALTADQARGVADLARRVEAHFAGTPQDVEWAIAGGALFLLQARPVTALPEPVVPVPVAVDAPPGYWRRVADHHPRPVSPLFRVFFDLINDEGDRALADAGLLLGGKMGGHREIGGWVYLNTTGVSDRTAPLWLVRLLLPVMLRAVPRVRAQVRRCVEAIRTDKAGRDVERWYAEWRPALASRVAELRAVELASLTDRDLDGHVGRVLDLTREGLYVHVVVHVAGWLLLGELAFACRDLLGWDDRQTFALVSGMSESSTQPALRLAELARLARERPAARALLERPDAGAAERLAATDPEFAAAFAAYRHEFGCRALRYEVAEATLAEQPELILGLIRDQIARDYDPAATAAGLERRAAAVASARAALADRPIAERERFERALARGERAYPLREDNEFHSVSAPLALLRYAALEIGRRLAERGAIGRSDDVFFLEVAEARAALGDGRDRRDLVAHRKAERAWVEAHPGPAAFGKAPGPPPSLGALPAEARFAVEAMQCLIERALGPAESAPERADGAGLTGIAASPGRYTGPVRVVQSEAEFGKLRAGDVLVCPITSPVWSVLFPSVGALVTDTGGILSHSAIIARGYGVPAVVATGDGTRRLRDGQVVTVDGGAGVVEALPA